jgi:hypothetical protein
MSKLEALANLPQTLEKFTQEAVQRIGGFIDEGNASKAALLAAGSAAALAPQEAEAGVVRQAGQIVHDLLSPVSASKMVGDEKIILDTPDLKIFQADPAYKPGKRESYRYVSYSNGVPVSALQIGTSGPRTKKAVIQNVRTDEPYQRQGHASKLLQRARQDFDIKHSTDLTDDGKAWAKSVGAAAGAGVLGAGALAPQEAEAGPLSAGIRTAFDDRFLNPTGGGNPRVKLRDKSAAMETTVDPRALDIGENVNLQDFEGSPYILTQSDRSAAGGLVTSVHNTPISPVDLRGG